LFPTPNNFSLERVLRIAEVFCHSVDTINTWVAEVIQWLCLPMVIIVTIEVILRYVFNRPTIWSWDISIQILALLTALGAGYALLQGTHVRVDVIVSRLPPRVNVIIDLVMMLLFFFGVGLLMWWFKDEMLDSIAVREVWESLWAPPLYPLKVIMFVGICLLLLQGLAKFIRDLIIITHPRLGKQL